MAQVVSRTDLVRGVLAALDTKDPVAVTARMTDDVRMRLGNADTVEGKAEFLEATTAFVASISAIRHEITSIWSFDDVVIGEMDVHYQRLDGTEVTLPCCLSRHRAGGRVRDEPFALRNGGSGASGCDAGQPLRGVQRTRSGTSSEGDGCQLHRGRDLVRLRTDIPRPRCTKQPYPGASRWEARFCIHRRGQIHVLRDLGHLPFNRGVPEQPPAISGYDVAQVRDGRIAMLYTLVNTAG